MKTSTRIGLGVAMGVSLIALVALAAGLPEFTLGEERLFHPEALLAFLTFFLNSTRLQNLLAALLLISILISLFMLLYTSRRGEPVKPSRWSWLASLQFILWVVAILLIRRQVRDLPQILNLPETLPGTASALPAAPEPIVTGNSVPGWLPFASSLLVALGLTLFAWLVLLRLRRPAPVLDFIRREARQTLRELQAGAGFENAILRCYAEMCQILERQRGLQREQGMTAREFEDRLLMAGLPEAPVYELTRLFEAARYGAQPPGGDAEQRAVSCLTQIAGATEAKP